MKQMKMSRQTVYLLVVTLILLVFVLLFSFFVLIPAGQEYRVARSVTNKHAVELEQQEQLSQETSKELKALQTRHKTIVSAFENKFDQAKFVAENKKYFQNLSLTKISKVDRQTPFDLYEVNATSKINSPAVFYNFLDSLNKSSWIIGVNFPIHFQKEGEFISASFTMRVYSLNDDINESHATAQKEHVVEQPNHPKEESHSTHE